MTKAGHIGLTPSRPHSASSPSWLEPPVSGTTGGLSSRPFYSRPCMTPTDAMAVRVNQVEMRCCVGLGPGASRNHMCSKSLQAITFFPAVGIPPMRRQTDGVGFSQHSVRQSHFFKHFADVAHQLFSSVSRFVFGNTDREGVAICARVHPVKRENHQRSLA